MDVYGKVVGEFTSIFTQYRQLDDVVRGDRIERVVQGVSFVFRTIRQYP